MESGRSERETSDSVVWSWRYCCQLLEFRAYGPHCLDMLWCLFLFVFSSFSSSFSFLCANRAISGTPGLYDSAAPCAPPLNLRERERTSPSLVKLPSCRTRGYLTCVTCALHTGPVPIYLRKLKESVTP